MKSLLDAIGAASGMRLEARRDVAGLKAAVFAKDAAAGELLDALAALFGAGWRRVEDPQGARYVLDLEPTTRSLIARRHEALLAAQMQSLEAYVAALGWPEERLATLPESDPIRQYLSQPASRAGLAFYAALSANERSRLWSRRRLSLPFRALPPLQQQTALAIARHIADSAAARPPTAVRQGMSQELDPEALQRGSVQLRLRTLAGQRMLFLTLPNGGIPVALAHLAPASPYHVSGNPYNAATGPLTAPADTAKPAEQALLLSDAFEAARALAEGTGRPVLRDFYRFARTPPPAQDSITNPPESPLDRLAERSHATWWLSGSALLFRSHDWHLLDLREPSDESLVRVARLMPRPPDRLSIGALQEYARLPLEQITGVNRRCGPHHAQRGREPLRRAPGTHRAHGGNARNPGAAGSLGTRGNGDWRTAGRGAGKPLAIRGGRGRGRATHAGGPPAAAGAGYAIPAPLRGRSSHGEGRHSVGRWTLGGCLHLLHADQS